MGFEIFSRKVQYKGNPAVTFTKMGRLMFNKAATVHFEKKGVETVFLLWDSQTRQVGVRPTTKKDNRSYKLNYGKKGNGAGFSAETFLNYIGYDRLETRSIPARWDEQEEMFVAEVPETYLTKKNSVSSKDTKTSSA